ncbi:MAG: hypothetical protein ABJE66_10510 [Deltaproteobacteria bacterium]
MRLPPRRGRAAHGHACIEIELIYETTSFAVPAELESALRARGISAAAKLRLVSTSDGFYAFSARGVFGQLVYVLPAQHLVGVRMIDSTHAEKTDELGNFGLLRRALVPAK